MRVIAKSPLELLHFNCPLYFIVGFEFCGVFHHKNNFLFALPLIMPNSTVSCSIKKIFICRIAAFSTVLLGLSKSIFLKFRGGKGVACNFAIWYYLSLPTGLIVSVVWFLFYRWKKIVSFASIVVQLFIPILVWFFNKEFFYLSLVLCPYIVFLHLQNIKKLLRKEEFVWTKR